MWRRSVLRPATKRTISISQSASVNEHEVLAPRIADAAADGVVAGLRGRGVTLA